MEDWIWAIVIIGFYKVWKEGVSEFTMDLATVIMGTIGRGLRLWRNKWKR